MKLIEYNIDQNRLEVGKLVEESSMDLQMTNNPFSLETRIKGEVIIEPTFVNRMELTPYGHLHIPDIFEDPYKDIDTFWYCLMAAGAVNLNGNNITGDSYDSLDPNHSTNGDYDLDKVKGNCVLITNSSFQDGFSTGNLDLMGYLGAPQIESVDIGPNSSVGSVAFVQGGNIGIESGHFRTTFFDDVYMSGSRAGQKLIPESLWDAVIPPFTSGTIPLGGTVDGVNYNYILDDGDYVVSSLSGKVLVRGNARLYVPSSFSITGNNWIRILESGKITMYSSAAQVYIGGVGIVNDTKDSRKCVLYGCSGITSIKFSILDDPLYFGIVAGPASIQIETGGASAVDFRGWILGATVKINGKIGFHFDENNRRVL
jgi:hypothetical protein